MEYIHPSATAPDASSTKLVFNKYGAQYLLAQVWTEADREMHKCFKCRLERALIAQNLKRESVVIASKH